MNFHCFVIFLLPQTVIFVILHLVPAMKITNEILQSILLDSGIVSRKEFDLAVKSAIAQDITLYQYLSESNIIKDDQLGQLVANYFSLPYINLNHLSIEDEVLKIIPEKFARQQKVISFLVENGELHIATPNPENIKIANLLKVKSDLPLKIHYTTEKSVREALDLYAKDVALAFEDLLAENIKQTKGSSGHYIEPPIIKIVDLIIDYAYKNKASDVHIEPEEDNALLRFRIDGMLHDIVKLPKKVHEQVVTRIKVMSDLRTDTRQIPQDGKIQVKMYDENLNLRVSTVPVVSGEKVVLRLLSEKSRNLTLADLGFKDESYERIKRGYSKPYGMILTTGPTGSGKTTTLYSILKLLNKREVNLMTIEDPVEYEIEGINQIQVNPKSGLTFANGLRSIVRQDPDIILVGEIRDHETAQIAVNSAMTGHLVLSTLHTNDAATTIPRLFDMGIEPFLVASSSNVIVGQRLVRKICEQCRHSLDLTQKEFKLRTQAIPEELIDKHFEVKKSIRVYEGKGCDVCHGTGYIGRIGIYEVMEVDEDIRRLIVTKSTSNEISAMAIKNGMTTMLEDGLEKIKMGITTIEEIVRVTKE